MTAILDYLDSVSDVSFAIVTSVFVLLVFAADYLVRRAE